MHKKIRLLLCLTVNFISVHGAQQAVVAAGVGQQVLNQEQQRALDEELLAAIGENTTAAEVHAVIGRGANVNRLIWGETPLQKAYQWGKKNVVDALYQAGADDEVYSDQTNTTLMSTLLHPSMLRYALRRESLRNQINVIARDSSVLMGAATVGNAQAVHTLLLAGAHADYQNTKGYTALMFANLANVAAAPDSTYVSLSFTPNQEKVQRFLLAASPQPVKDTQEILEHGFVNTMGDGREKNEDALKLLQESCEAVEDFNIAVAMEPLLPSYMAAALIGITKSYLVDPQDEAELRAIQMREIIAQEKEKKVATK